MCGNNKSGQFAMTLVPSREYKLILEQFSTQHMIGLIYGINYIFYQHIIIRTKSSKISSYCIASCNNIYIILINAHFYDACNH